MLLPRYDFEKDSLHKDKLSKVCLKWVLKIVVGKKLKLCVWGGITLRSLAVMEGEVGGGFSKMGEINIFMCQWDKFGKRQIEDKGGSIQVLRQVRGDRIKHILSVKQSTTEVGIIY